MASIAISAGGCGGSEHAPDVARGESTKADSRYVEILLGFRKAANSNTAYDAYGYGESDLPDSQRAAVDGFCVVVSRVRTDSESEVLSDPAHFSAQVVAAARPEAQSASMATIRRAIDKLQAVIRPESLNPTLVKSYAHACY